MKTDSTYIQQILSEHDYMDQINEGAPKDQVIEVVPSGGNNFRELLQPLSTVIVIMLFGVLLWVIVRKMSQLGHDDGHDAQPTDMGGDTIYDHQWQSEISQAQAVGRYDDVAVLCYLYWLSRLDADGIIAFSAAKTPGIFLEEVRQHADRRRTGDDNEQKAADPTLVDTTDTLTNHYLRVRYGHKHIDARTARSIMTLVKI